MQIIDAHLHFSQIETFHQTAINLSGVKYSSEGLRTEYSSAKVALGIAMGVTETAPGEFPDCEVKNPMMTDLEPVLPENLVQCIGINPGCLHASPLHDLDVIENALNQQRVVGIKLYPGYYPFYATDPVYAPIYELAKMHQFPVIIHCGNTYSERGLLKYAHPLAVDEAAAEHRHVNFVIAHMGDPWVMESAEIAYKNPNVFVDLSGLIVGDANEVNRVRQEPLLMNHFKRGPVYTDNYEKYLFGSDWPLVPIAPYVQFIQQLIPEAHHENVFYQNALRVFPKLQEIESLRREQAEDEKISKQKMRR
jgi:hypothetical protein